jgi:hypothetical protein
MVGDGVPSRDGCGGGGPLVITLVVVTVAVVVMVDVLDPFAPLARTRP